MHSHVISLLEKKPLCRQHPPGVSKNWLIPLFTFHFSGVLIKLVFSHRTFHSLSSSGWNRPYCSVSKEGILWQWKILLGWDVVTVLIQNSKHEVSLSPVQLNWWYKHRIFRKNPWISSKYAMFISPVENWSRNPGNSTSPL